MASTKILVWNVRGLNGRSRCDTTRNVVDLCKPEIVCLQETKLAVISSWDVASFLGRDYTNFVYL